MKKAISISMVASALFLVVNFASASTLDSSDWLRKYQNSGARDMCAAEAFDTNVDNVLLEEIPSILEECGIGGIFDLCSLLGNFGKILGPYVGCGSTGGRGRSLFCDWGFDSRSAKEAWRVYKRNTNMPKLPSIGDVKDAFGNNSDVNDVLSDDLNKSAASLALTRLKVMGLDKHQDLINVGS